MSQRYDQPLTSQPRRVSDLSFVPVEAGHTVSTSAAISPASSPGSLSRPALSPDLLSFEDVALKAASLEADGGAVVSTQAVVAVSHGRGAGVSRPDFYGRGTRQAAGRVSRRGWLAWAFLDGYSWRAILLMLSFLAFGLVVSSFVLSL